MDSVVVRAGERRDVFWVSCSVRGDGLFDTHHRLMVETRLTLDRRGEIDFLEFHPGLPTFFA